MNKALVSLALSALFVAGIPTQTAFADNTYCSVTQFPAGGRNRTVNCVLSKSTRTCTNTCYEYVAAPNQATANCRICVLASIAPVNGCVLHTSSPQIPIMTIEQAGVCNYADYGCNCANLIAGVPGSEICHTTTGSNCRTDGGDWGQDPPADE